MTGRGARRGEKRGKWNSRDLPKISRGDAGKFRVGTIRLCGDDQNEDRSVIGFGGEGYKDAEGGTHSSLCPSIRFASEVGSTTCCPPEIWLKLRGLPQILLVCF